MKLWEKLLVSTMGVVGFLLTCEPSGTALLAGLLLIVWATVITFHWQFSRPSVRGEGEPHGA